MSQEYLPRLIDGVLPELMSALPAIALGGAKGVGKTASAERVATTSLRLDAPAVRELVEADASHALSAPRPVLVDEWQRVPTLWDAVRRAVDDGAAPGSYLLTGSAYPRGAAIHSGAGRIVPLRMRPLSLAERALVTPTVSLQALLRGGAPVTGSSPVSLVGYVGEIVGSGFPGIRTTSPVARTHVLDSYIGNVIEREFPEQGLMVRAPATLRRWLRAYAAATSTTTSYQAILEAATPGEPDKPAKKTTIAYRDVLHSLWLLDPVEAWVPDGHALGRLGQAPKHFLADPALAVRLLDLTEADLLMGAGDAIATVAVLAARRPLLGRLFEALVALSLQVYADHLGARLRHLRTRNGDHEVDFIIEKGPAVVGIEVKLSSSVDDADLTHLRWLRERRGPLPTELIVVTTGPTAYRRKDGIGVVPASLLGP
ncbi:MAG: DUF4143 domain-containing protein [Microbacterium sp.]